MERWRDSRWALAARGVPGALLLWPVVQLGPVGALVLVATGLLPWLEGLSRAWWLAPGRTVALAVMAGAVTAAGIVALMVGGHLVLAGWLGAAVWGWGRVALRARRGRAALGRGRPVMLACGLGAIPAWWLYGDDVRVLVACGLIAAYAGVGAFLALPAFTTGLARGQRG